ncbi:MULTISPECIES: flagellar motor switch protein FliN [Acidobacterium]|nr:MULTISPECIES: flagellar motor switch protein FliN [Acidobacterium]
MKAFWDIWNREFATAAAGRMGRKEGEVAWSAADELPAAQDTLAVVLRWDEAGRWRGSVTLLASRAEVAALLAAPGTAEDGTVSSTAAPGDEELPARWIDWLQDVLAAMPMAEPPAQIEPTARPQGVPVTPYVLRAGSLAVRMAMICELSEKAAKAPETAARPAPASSGQPSAAASPASAANVDLLLDIEVDASLRFGSRELAIRELLETGPGDVLELDRHITDPVDLVVGDKIVARGEVVLVNGNFGLRVTEVAEPKKCLESVRCLF